ncbi:hypothetical protein FisN_12Hh023 [Fistulifera solaris]|uniref:Transmembrane and coiled-coil domain-containing protein 4 n=1 Tax=Fistulifera solaris TaxID=1519565 RepID=A0A1Z5K2D5_FISSO|nr:hypothetical protein FisN_12Hh023 [Fistulifera solaris]|eukprot:GAX20178.1 hypothetical protein FisN_12Hh023 [Fistulifera solaris]
MNSNNLRTPPRAKLETVCAHPLSDEITFHSAPEINTASYIQAAARSILDGSPSGTNVSDDDSCSNGHQKTSSFTLESLQKQVAPAMPDEQDRKRFLGCLAAVLAKMYSYDNLKDIEDGQINAEAMAYYERSESSGCDDFDDLDRTVDSSVGGSFDFDSEDSQHNGGQSSGNPHQAAKKALSRHRRRRYNVLSELLLSSADLLMVDKGSAKAFLPMLSKLMFPQAQESFVDSETSMDFRRSRKDDVTKRRHKSQDVVSQCIDNVDFLRPFLESMSPGSGFRCLALCLLQHLLRNEKGYDARIRYAFKEVGVFVLIHDLEKDPVDVYLQERFSRGKEERSRKLIELATRKFEFLEHWIARELLKHSNEAKVPSTNESRGGDNGSNNQSKAYEYEQMMRRLKIGGAAIVAGTLFAVSGGLAAPILATTIGTIAGGTAVTAVAASILTSTAAVTAIFGVGGGSLAAYKMQRRTQGLTEFNFMKVCGNEHSNDTHGVEAELFSTICLSGWLRDKFDFQRPWGVNPTNPPLRDRLELLQRFYQIYRPNHVLKCEKILEQWKGEESELWKLLEQKYGRNPDNLFPLVDGPRTKADLTLEQREIVEHLFFEIIHGSPSDTVKQNHPAEATASSTDCTSVTTRTNSSFNSWSETNVSGRNDTRLRPEDNSEAVPAYIRNIWDYKANYGGELYTVKWESSLLQELCDSVTDLAFDVVSGGTAQLLKHTALSTLLSAFAWPWALVNAANLIDGTWTLAAERSDEAGKELARSLLFSGAGNRPVVLIGYSFGARVVYACLKELARYQEAWEDYQEQLTQKKQGRFRNPSQKKDEMFSKMREPASIVEDAILMGLPNHLSLSSWKACRQVVAGRLVNCFSQKDLILSLMFQLKRFGGLKPVCGVCAVKVAGVENVDVTDLVLGHQDYTTCIGDILEKVRHGQPFPSRFFSRKTISRNPATDVSKLDI